MKAQTRPPQEADQDAQVGLEDDTPSEERTAERDETLQPEVLEEKHPWEELKVAIKRNGFRLKVTWKRALVPMSGM